MKFNSMLVMLSVASAVTLSGCCGFRNCKAESKRLDQKFEQHIVDAKDSTDKVLNVLNDHSRDLRNQRTKNDNTDKFILSVVDDMGEVSKRIGALEKIHQHKLKKK